MSEAAVEKREFQAIQSLNDGEVIAPDLRERIFKLEAALVALPDAAHRTIETMHHFAEGTYTRTVLMKKGELITGKIHKLDHVVIVSQGSAIVIGEEFGRVRITAPAIFKSAPGAKRVLLIEEDMIWTTVHPNPSNTQDMVQLEEELIAKNFEEVRSL